MTTWSAVSIPLLFFWLAVVPFFTGIVVTSFFPYKMKTIGAAWITGLLAGFVLFEPVALFCMLTITYESFLVCVRVYSCVMMVLAVLGAVMLVRRAVIRRGAPGIRGLMLALFPGYGEETLSDLMHPRRDAVRFDRRFGVSESIYFAAFLLMFLIQAVMAVRYAFFDGDDAYYVVVSVLADQTDTMYTILPYTGYSTALDFRHALATWTLWTAFIARSCHIHAAVLIHTVLQPYLLAMCYYAYFLVAMRLFRRRLDMVPLFLCFISICSMFGNVSIYTRETFFMMRTWQGKAMVGSFIIPLMFFLLLGFTRDEAGLRWVHRTPVEKRTLWFLLLMVNISASFFSTSGIMITLALTAAGFGIPVLFTGWRGDVERKQLIRHKMISLGAAASTCIPNVALAAAGWLLSR
ncbi:MAG: hypothetical protein K6C95_05710 [Lachnospiraceae bacterium]|nr:hypothetical protein [Lachnospiraceae bacterium]